MSLQTYIALLRGINVGGKNKLRMAELRELCQTLGCTDVRSYIQSGNLVFQHATHNTAQLAADIRTAIGGQHGFEPQVLILKEDDFRSAANDNPYPEAEAAPKTLHLYFLAAPAVNPDFATLSALKQDTERFTLVGRVFYLHAPDGIGRSKLAARVEKALGVATTARNWRTVSKIMAMLASGI